MLISPLTYSKSTPGVKHMRLWIKCSCSHWWEINLLWILLTLAHCGAVVWEQECGRVRGAVWGTEAITQTQQMGGKKRKRNVASHLKYGELSTHSFIITGTPLFLQYPHQQCDSGGRGTHIFYQSESSNSAMLTTLQAKVL